MQQDGKAEYEIFFVIPQLGTVPDPFSFQIAGVCFIIKGELLLRHGTAACCVVKQNVVYKTKVMLAKTEVTTDEGARVRVTTMTIREVQPASSEETQSFLEISPPSVRQLIGASG